MLDVVFIMRNVVFNQCSTCPVTLLHAQCIRVPHVSAYMPEHMHRTTGYQRLARRTVPQCAQIQQTHMIMYEQVSLHIS